MIYQFKYDEIRHCHDCPLFYDYIHCELDIQDNKYIGYTDSDDNVRPDWCPLKELPELKPSKPKEIEPGIIINLAAYAKRSIPRAVELTYEFFSTLTHFMSKQEYMEYINIVKTILKTEVTYHD